MALNNYGLGFVIGGEDDGATRSADDTSQSLQLLTRAVEKLEDVANSSKFGAIIESWSAVKLADIAGQMDNLADSAQSADVAGSLDSTYAEFNKTFGAMGVSMNLGQKEAQKWRGIISGTARAMDIGMDEAADAFAAFRKENIDLTKVVATGRGSTRAGFKALMKTMQVLGMEGESLAAIYSGLQKGFGFSTKQVRDLGDWMAYAGQKAGDAKSVMGAWPEVINAINEQTADLNVNLGPKEVTAMAQGVVKLGIALNKGVGVPMKDATGKATTFFTSMIGMRKDLQSMVVGMGEDMGQFGELMKESGGDVQGMFHAMQKDPLNFLKFFQRVSAEAKGGSATATRLMVKFHEAFGGDADTTWLMRSGDEAFQRIAKTLAAIPPIGNKTAGTMSKIGKAFRTSRTLDDWLGMVRENFDTKLKSLIRTDARDFVKNQSAAYKNLGNSIGFLAKGDGPVSELTKGLLRLKTLGLAGALPKSLRGIADGFEVVLDNGLPLMTAAGAMGLKFGDLGRALGAPILGPLALLNKATGGLGGVLLKTLGPVGLVVTAIGYLGTHFSEAGSKGASNFVKMFTEKLPYEIARIARKFGPKWVREMIEPLVGKRGRKTIQRTVKWKELGRVFMVGLKKAWVFVRDNFDAGVMVIKDLLNKLSLAIESVNWGTVFSKVGEWLVKGSVAVADAIGTFLSKLFSPKEVTEKTSPHLQAGMSGTVAKVFSSLGGAVKTGVTKLYDDFTKWLSDDSVSFGEKAAKIGKVIGVALVGGMLFSSTVRGLALKGSLGLLGVVKKCGTAASAGAEAAGCLAGGFVGKLKKVGKWVGDKARWLWALPMKKLAGGRKIAKIFGSIGKVFTKNFWRGVWWNMRFYFRNFPTLLKGLVGKGLPKVLGAFKVFGAKLLIFGKFLGKALFKSLGLFMIINALMGLPDLVRGIGAAISKENASAGDTTMAISESVFGYLLGLFGVSSKTGSKIWAAMVDEMSEQIFSFMSGLEYVWVKMKGIFWGGFNFVKALAFKVFGAIHVKGLQLKLVFQEIASALRDVWTKIATSVTDMVTSMTYKVIGTVLKIASALPEKLRGPVGEVLENMNTLGKQYRKTQTALYARHYHDLKRELGKAPEYWQIAHRVQASLEKRARDEQRRSAEVEASKGIADTNRRINSIRGITQGLIGGVAADNKSMFQRYDKDSARAAKGFWHGSPGQQRVIIRSSKGTAAKVKPKARVRGKTVAPKVPMPVTNMPVTDVGAAAGGVGRAEMEGLRSSISSLQTAVNKLATNPARLELVGDAKKLFRVINRAGGNQLASQGGVP